MSLSDQVLQAPSAPQIDPSIQDHQTIESQQQAQLRHNEPSTQGLDLDDFPTVQQRQSMGRRPGRPGRRPGSKRRPWTREEVANILEGCAKFGVGKWKEILAAYPFNERTPVDLKDKFRNLKMKYDKNKPGINAAAAHNASPSVPTDPALMADTTPTGAEVSAHTGDNSYEALDAANGAEGEQFSAILRELPYAPHRKRVPFTPEEDANIRDGVQKYGKSWSNIAKAPEYGFVRRTGPDIRTRFSILLAKGDLDRLPGDHKLPDDVAKAVAAVTAGASAMQDDGSGNPHTSGAEVTMADAVAAINSSAVDPVAAMASQVAAMPEASAKNGNDIKIEGPKGARK